MSEGMQLELKKPLDKMTAKELRELAMKQLPQVVGASGMDKDELLGKIKEVLGMSDAEGGPKTSPYKGQILGMKRKMRDLRAKKVELSAETGTSKAKDILRRKINKLKKRTRRLSATA